MRSAGEAVLMESVPGGAGIKQSQTAWALVTATVTPDSCLNLSGLWLNLRGVG